MIITKTPFRMSFFGGGTDMENFFRENGGAVLSTTFDKYASFLDDKKTLTVEEMNEIFDMMDDEKKISYDKGYIENLYLNYMEMGRVQENHKEELESLYRERKIYNLIYTY